MYHLVSVSWDENWLERLFYEHDGSDKFPLEIALLTLYELSQAAFHPHCLSN